MPAYTPPSPDAVNFALGTFTPADITPHESALASTTPAEVDAADFALVSYTQPTFPDAGFDLSASFTPDEPPSPPPSTGSYVINLAAGISLTPALLAQIIEECGTCNPCGGGSSVFVSCAVGQTCSEVPTMLTLSVTVTPFLGLNLTPGDYPLMWLENEIYEQQVDNSTTPCTVTILGQGAGWFSDYFDVDFPPLGTVRGRFLYDACSGSLDFSYEQDGDCPSEPSLKRIILAGAVSFTIDSCLPYLASYLTEATVSA